MPYTISDKTKIALLMLVLGTLIGGRIAYGIVTYGWSWAGVMA